MYINGDGMVRSNTLKFLPILIMVLFTGFNILLRTEGIVFLFCIIYIFTILALSNKSLTIAKPNMFFVSWLIYSTIQMMLIDYAELTSLHYQVIFLGFILIWFMNWLINSKSTFEMVYVIWGITVLFTIIIGWWEIFSGNHIANVEEGKFNFNFASVNFYNPNNYSFFLSVSFPVVLYWIERLGVVYKIIGIFMLISSFSIIYINGSRISLLVLIVVFLPLIIKVLLKKKKLIIPILLLLICCLSYFYGDLVDTLTISSTDDSMNQRTFLYSAAIQIFLNHPFGVGPGSLEAYMPIVGLNVHNFWLEILVNYGFVVFFGMVIFFGITLYKLFNVKSESLKYLTKPLFLTVLIFIPTSIAPSSIFTFSITWFIFGMMVSMVKIIEK